MTAPTVRARAPVAALGFVALGLLALPLLGACVSDRTFGEELDDASSATDIKTKLFWAGGASRFSEVDVAVVDRFVLLSGRVASEADRQEAERLAWQVNSIDEVANELKVENWDLGRDFNDAFLTEQVRLRLFGDNTIRAANFNIQVHSGVVYLLGVARSQEELRAAAEHASMVGGVQKVVSYVKLRERTGPSPQISVADAPPAQQDGEPIRIAPAPPPAGSAGVVQPAPIVPPETAPTTRPGAPSSNIPGLTSAPLPPPR